jgi:hypothetical protein
MFILAVSVFIFCKSYKYRKTIHLQGGDSYTLDQINDAAYEASKDQLVPCENCGRKFGFDRIQVHQRSCKPGNTAKPINVCLFYSFNLCIVLYNLDN